MKKTTFFGGLLTLLLLGSCQDILQEDPKGLMAGESFWTSDGNAVGAINGIYARPLQNGIGGLDWAFWMETSGLDYGVVGDNAFNMGTWLPTNGNFSLLWSQSYSCIARANWALANLPTAQVEAGLKRRLEGETLFLRAMHYFNLVRSFGDVPLVLTPTVGTEDVNVARSPSADVYAAIVNDLTKAIDLLPLKSGYAAVDKGRATKGAAQGLLAKVYLTLKNWQKARELTSAVIQSNEYRLEARYANVWLPANDNGPEWLFSYQSAGTNTTSHQTAIWAFPLELNNIDGFSVGFGNLLVSPRLLALFNPNDDRLKTTIWSEYTTNAGRLIKFGRGAASKKYYDVSWNTNYRFTRVNYPVLRYSDILLMHAEAENELNGPTAEAFARLNQVRGRVGLSALTTNELPTKDAFLTEVLDERRREFFNENQRYFDLKRRDLFLAVARTHPRSQHTDNAILFPIPQSEIDINPNLKQNPGY